MKSRLKWAGYGKIGRGMVDEESRCLDDTNYQSWRDMASVY